ncbi:MAG: phosphoribosyltransferase [Kiritimatiellia bacterium]
MERKLYLDARDYLHDAWRLARQILDSGWRPDLLLALWRGGAAVGVAVHEYLKAQGVAVRHLPVKCSSYTGIGQSGTEVKFECADAVFAQLAPGMKVLVVDDVFDTGRTAAALHGKLAAGGCEMRMACVYWKPAQNVTPYKPDFHVRALDRWIVFPHEIEGLTPAEIAEKDAVLADLMNR